MSRLSMAASSSRLSTAASVEWLDAYSEIYTDSADIVVVRDDNDDDDDDPTIRAMSQTDSNQVRKNIPKD